MTPITLDNKKVHDYIVQKDVLVTEGRKISQEIEKIEAKILAYEKKEMAITGNVKPAKELTDKGDALTKEINKLAEELTKLSDQITRAKLDAIPKDMADAHKALMKEKEEKERDRNKIALKVQKLKDKLVPIVQREVKPILQQVRMVQVDMGKYDDIETAKAKDGKVVISTFNHLDEYRRKFRG
jgi:predicted  nucleic acid-binding Zn-ribbon protein